MDRGHSSILLPLMEDAVVHILSLVSRSCFVGLKLEVEYSHNSECQRLGHPESYYLALLTVSDILVKKNKVYNSSVSLTQ